MFLHDYHLACEISTVSTLTLKQQNAKSVMDASIWVMFFSKNSHTRTLDQSSLLNSPFIIPSFGFQFRSTDLADEPHL